MDSVGTAQDQSGYGGLAYYSDEACGYNGHSFDNTSCTNNYSQSDIKYVIDSWALDNVPNGLVEVRLISIQELLDNLGFEYYEEGTNSGYRKSESTPNWAYNSDYKYWTMDSSGDNSTSIYQIFFNGNCGSAPVYGSYIGVATARPVIVLSKSVLASE